MQPVPSTAALLARCDELIDVLAAGAEEGEVLRRLPDATMKAVADAGILGAVVPTSLGGAGLGLDALCGASRLLAHGCPASAWTISFLIQHAWLLAKLPPAGREVVFADTIAPTAACPLAPTGTAAPVDGGYVVSGRWEYATGIRHADWVMVHALEEGAGFTTRFVVLPVGDVTIEDVWFTSGMRATGSETVHVHEQFVPAHLSLPARALLDGALAVPGDGLAGIPVISVLALSAAGPALGAAEAAVELYRARTAERVLAYTMGERAAEQPAAQMRLAAAADAVAAARAHHDRAVATIAAAAAAGPPSDRRRVEAKLAAASTVRASRAVISTVCEGAGAAVYGSGHPLQRLQRDVEVLKGHAVFDWDRSTQLAGRVMLGAALGPTDLA